MPAGEAVELLVQLLLLLLAHRAAQDVGLAERVAGELLGDRHHLLLVDDQAVGLAEDRPRAPRPARGGSARPARGRSCGGRTCCGSRRPSGRAGRARRPRRCRRSCRAASSAAAPASARRRAGRRRACRRAPAARRSPRSSRVEVLEHDLSRRGCASMLISASSRTVRLRRPRKSILIRPRRLAGRVVELGDDRAVLAGARMQRDDVDQRLAGHDHAGGVHAPLALEALDADRGVDDPS